MFLDIADPARTALQSPALSRIAGGPRLGTWRGTGVWDYGNGGPPVGAWSGVGTWDAERGQFVGDVWKGPPLVSGHGDHWQQGQQGGSYWTMGSPSEWSRPPSGYNSHGSPLGHQGGSAPQAGGYTPWAPQSANQGYYYYYVDNKPAQGGGYNGGGGGGGGSYASGWTNYGTHGTAHGTAWDRRDPPRPG